MTYGLADMAACEASTDGIGMLITSQLLNNQIIRQITYETTAFHFADVERSLQQYSQLGTECWIQWDGIQEMVGINVHIQEALFLESCSACGGSSSSRNIILLSIQCSVSSKKRKSLSLQCTKPPLLPYCESFDSHQLILSSLHQQIIHPLNLRMTNRTRLPVIQSQLWRARVTAVDMKSDPIPQEQCRVSSHQSSSSRTKDYTTGYTLTWPRQLQ